MIIFTVLLAVPTQNPAPSTQLTHAYSQFFQFNVEMHKFAGTRGKPSACALDYRPISGLMAPSLPPGRWSGELENSP